MSMPRAVRHINEMRVLDVVFRHGRISRANIARELAMTRSTAGNIVAGLAGDGFVIEDDSEEDKAAGTGRPGTFVRLNPQHGLFIGADIGVGRIVVVALDFEANPVARQEVELSSGKTTAERAMAALAATLRRLLDKVAPAGPVRGLCLTVPGVIGRDGAVLRAPFLGWRNEPVLEMLHGLLPQIPILIAENDANAFAIGEAYRNRRADSATEVYIFLDAGVGGAIVNDGKLLRGQDGYAGEFGHMILGEEGFIKLATPYGSFESFIGREAILARHRYHGGSSQNFGGFLAAAKAGEAPALATLKDWTFYLGRGLALISSIFNPGRIVLGGPVAALFRLCEKDVLRNIRLNLLDDYPTPNVVLSEMGSEGPAIGGASILHRRMLSVDEELVFGSPAQRTGAVASG